jgi:hypothetical protein
MRTQHPLNASKEDAMRTTPELIQELKSEAKEHYAVMLAVAFESSTILVKSTDADDDALATLNETILQGGIPVGLIAFDKRELADGRAELLLRARIFPEHDGARQQAANYMQRMIEQAAEKFGA